MPIDLRPPPGALVLQTVEAHSAGEPLRIITSGFPPLPGRTMLDKRRFAREHYDDLRRSLMWEPRGHADMYGALLVEPERPDSHLGVLFLHNQGFSTMCGHGVIALTTAALETGMVCGSDPETTVLLDTPAGQVSAVARMAAGRVEDVTFRNVPSFVAHHDLRVEVAGHGSLRLDIAFGGAFYALCRAGDFGFDLTPGETGKIIAAGRAVMRAASSLPLHHPDSGEMAFLYGAIFVGAAHEACHHSRNVCVFAEGEVDRSPTGTGVSARAALHHARGELRAGEPFTVESLLGTCFTGRVTGSLEYGPFRAVRTDVTGSGYLTGRQEIWLDPRDPLRMGFFLR